MKTLSIAFVGPECTGKTTLTEALAAHYHTPFVAEYARTYLDNLHRSYTEADLLVMAKEQYLTEQKITHQAESKGLYFADTTLLVVYVWAIEKYGRVAPWIKQKVQQMRYTLQFLCYPDTPWIPDPQREAPDLAERIRLFKIYEQHLKMQKQNFLILKGTLEEKIAASQVQVNDFLRT